MCADNVTVLSADNVTVLCADNVTVLCADNVTVVCADNVTVLCADNVTVVCASIDELIFYLLFLNFVHILYYCLHVEGWKQKGLWIKGADRTF